MPPARGRDGHPLVLVVDDEPTTRLLAREALTAAGLAVAEAADGAQGLEVCREAEPDLVLLDVRMPRLDGFATLAELRTTPQGRHTPVIMMTGVDDLPSIRRAYELGATDFVNKPINWVILGHRVEYVLRASRRAEELRRSRGKLANAQRIARLGYWEWTPPGGELQLSGEMARILGAAEDELMVTVESYLRSVHPDDRDEVRDLLSRGGGADCGEIEYRIARPDGGVRHVHQQVDESRDGQGQVTQVTAIVQDVTERKDAERQIRFLALYDGLTGLPNRRAFTERLDLAVAGSRRHGTVGAILVIDLDRFKRINETLGYGAGDRLLREVAQRLVSSVRSTDCVGRPGPGDLVARSGGDEFVLLLSAIDDANDAVAIGRRLAGTLVRPFQIDEREVFVSASVGIAVFPDDGENAEALFQNAEAAMFHAKSRGGNSCQYYSESMNAAALERLALESGLRKALAAGELELYYQPQLSLSTGRIVGVEALIRWHHPEMGMILPASFIPLAEEAGLIAEIGEWVLATACQQAVAWQREGRAPLRVAVNLSARQFAQWNLPRVVAQALADSGLDADLLELELTESALLQDEELTRRMLAELKALGVRLAVDDFGTGYSSLAYLRRFPLNALKIDRSFLQGVPDQEDNAAIIQAIVAMAKGLRLEAVAEGIEEEGQLAFLKEQGCELAQGFLFARPMCAERVAALLATDAAAHAPAAAAATA